MLCCLVPRVVKAQQYPFQPKEKISYTIHYNWGFIWVSAGEVDFTVAADTVFQQPAFRFTGKGKTFSKYDWIYRVRDTYESTVDQENLRPFTFIRDVEEGNTYINNAYVFDHSRNVAYSIIKNKKVGTLRDTISVTESTFDVISMIYRSRLIDYSKYQVNDKIPITLLLDNQVYDTYIRYLGTEVIDFKGIKPITCYKFKPYLIEGTIFTGGEDMTVWVTADENKIPVYIESKILVGNIKAILSGTKGLQTPKQYLEE